MVATKFCLRGLKRAVVGRNHTSKKKKTPTSSIHTDHHKNRQVATHTMIHVRNPFKRFRSSLNRSSNTMATSFSTSVSTKQEENNVRHNNKPEQRQDVANLNLKLDDMFLEEMLLDDLMDQDSLADGQEDDDLSLILGPFVTNSSGSS